MLRIVALLLAAMWSALAVAQEIGLERYENPRFGYTIALPMGLFEVDREADNGDGLSLRQIGGDAQLDVYGAFNAGGLTPAEFARELESAERIREVTYRAGGRTWFVRSGYYRREGEEREDLIFYAKFMFSADGTAVSAFEISYPEADRRRLDPVVERLEDSLRAPKS